MDGGNMHTEMERIKMKIWGHKCMNNMQGFIQACWGRFPSQKFESPLKILAKIRFSLLFSIYFLFPPLPFPKETKFHPNTVKYRGV